MTSPDTTTPGTRRRIYSESEVFKLARRAARRHGILLRRAKLGSETHRELGRYVAVNAETGFIEASRVRLEDAAMDLGILGPGDSIVWQQAEAGGQGETGR